jgi:hypothetical protein
MKKIRIAVCIFGAFFLLPGASVWEGAAAVAPNGELPDGGYYVATNSFPRNTVVEVTNLETGKTVRVIVAVGLDSPGLLATLSRDAAALIGLQSRSIGRVRMTMPSDPIAFSRFIEGLGSSGDPDFDPQAQIASSLPESASTVPAAPEAAFTDIPEPAAEKSGRVFAETPLWAGAEDSPAEIPEPPRTARETVNEQGVVGNIPEAYTPPAAPAVDRSIVPEPSVVYPGARDPIPEGRLPEPNPSLSEGFPPETPSSRAETVLPPETPPSRAETVPPPEEPAGVPDWSPDTHDLTLIPAEERPPEASPYGELPPESIIPLPDAAMAGTVPEKRIVIDPRYFIDPIERADPADTSGTAEIPPVLADPVPPVAAETPPVLADPAPPVALQASPVPVIFSVPVISRLERGKYYLQLGAFSKPESVELELSKIGKTYPLAIQAGDNGEEPLYRILLGPVNLGESGALLRRFKGSGYGDAFIRQEG